MKRAPPPSASPSSTAAAVRLGDRAHDRQAQAAAAAAAAVRRRRARSARTPARASPAGRPGRGRRPRAPRARRRGGTETVDRRALRRVQERVLDQVGDQAVQVVGRAADRSPARGRRRCSEWSSCDRARLGRPPRARSRRGRAAAWASRGRRRRGPAAAGRRPAGACAATSAAPTSPSRAARPRARSASSSRLARMLVSGVRSSCEASATNSRWRSSEASVSPRAALSSPQHVLERVRQVGDLVVGLGFGSVHVGVARAGDLARGARQAGDRPHRAACHDQPAEQRQQRPAEHAEGEEQPHAVDRARRSRSPACRTAGRRRLGPQRARRRLEQPLLLAHRLDQRPRHDAVVADVDHALGRGRHQGARARPGRRPRLSRRSTTRTSAAAGGGAAQRLAADVELAAGVDGRRADLVLQVGGGGAQVVVEAGADALLGDGADHDREQAQDHERERRRRPSPA